MVQKLIVANRGGALVAALAFGAVLSITGLGIVKVISLGTDLGSAVTEEIRAKWSNEAAAQIAVRYCALNPQATAGPLTVMPELKLNKLGSTDLTLESIHDTSMAIVEKRPWAWRLNLTTKSAHRKQYHTNYNEVCASAFPYYSVFDNKGYAKQQAWVNEVIYGNYHTNGYVALYQGLAEKTFVTGRMSSAGRLAPLAAIDHAFPALESDYRRGISLVDVQSNAYVNFPASPSYLWFIKRFPRYQSVSSISTDVLKKMTVTPPTQTLFTIKSTPLLSEAGVTFEGSSIRLWKFNYTSASWVAYKSISLPQQPDQIQGNVIVSEVPLYIQGTLNGRLTLLTTKNASVYITRSIVYSNEDFDCSDGSCTDDALAVIAAGSLYIANSDSLRADKGLLVHGCLLAPNGVITVEDLDEWPKNGVVPFVVVGSLLADAAGQLSTINGQGVAETVFGDPRFFVNRSLPPAIPLAMQKDILNQQSQVAAIVRGTWSSRVVYAH